MKENGARTKPELKQMRNLKLIALQIPTSNVQISYKVSLIQLVGIRITHHHMHKYHLYNSTMYPPPPHT